MRVAAYQSLLVEATPESAIDLIRSQLERCVQERVSVLCCPEAILGGLADYSDDPFTFGIVICNDSNFGEPIRLIAARGHENSAKTS